MIYKGQTCGRMIRVLAHPPPPPPPVSKLSLFLSLLVYRRSRFLTGEEEGSGGRGAKSYDREKAWSSINHSLLSAVQQMDVGK